VNFAPKSRNSAGVLRLVEMSQFSEKLLLLGLVLAHLNLVVVIAEVSQTFRDLGRPLAHMFVHVASNAILGVQPTLGGLAMVAIRDQRHSRQTNGQLLHLLLTQPIASLLRLLQTLLMACAADWISMAARGVNLLIQLINFH